MRLKVVKLPEANGDDSTLTSKLHYVDKFNKDHDVEGRSYVVGDASGCCIKLFVVGGSGDFSHLDQLRIGDEMVIFYASAVKGRFLFFNLSRTIFSLMKIILYVNDMQKCISVIIVNMMIFKKCI